MNECDSRWWSTDVSWRDDVANIHSLNTFTVIYTMWIPLQLDTPQKYLYSYIHHPNTFTIYTIQIPLQLYTQSEYLYSYIHHPYTFTVTYTIQIPLQNSPSEYLYRCKHQSNTFTEHTPSYTFPEHIPLEIWLQIHTIWIPLQNIDFRIPLWNIHNHNNFMEHTPSGYLYGTYTVRIILQNIHPLNTLQNINPLNLNWVYLTVDVMKDFW